MRNNGYKSWHRLVGCAPLDPFWPDRSVVGRNNLEKLTVPMQGSHFLGLQTRCSTEMRRGQSTAALLVAAILERCVGICAVPV